MMKKISAVFKIILIVIVLIYCRIDVLGQKAHVNDDYGKKINEPKLTKQHMLKKVKANPVVFSEKKKTVKGIVKFDQPNKFAEFEKKIRTRDGELSPRYKVGYQVEELAKARQNRPLGKMAANLNWIERGPGNVSGRTRGILIDPRDVTHRTWIAGSVGGGIWKTTNAGVNWVNKTPDMPNLATTVLAQAASNPDIIYCGTGEGFYNADAIGGGGIFKSIDSAHTWTLLASTTNANFKNINRIIVSPTDPNIVLAATNDGPAGIWRSVDGGSNWTKVFSATERVQDLRATPGNFQVQYSTVNGDGVYKSTDGGVNWVKSSTGLVSGSRYEICVSPKNPLVLYANIETATGSALAFSNDGAASWTTVTVSSGTAPDWLNGQGWYDNTIEAHPYNTNIVFFGGVDLWKGELTGSTSSTNVIKGIDEESSGSFLDFYDWDGSYQNTGIGKGTDFFNFAPFTAPMFQLTDNDYATVELQFGQGKSQMAHRFVRSSSTGNYEYKNYVSVPFVAWDKTNNRQITISFRDGLDNGVFDLVVLNNANIAREYICINAVPYNAATPNPNIAVTNGHVYKNIFTMWPMLASGTWNPSSLPNSTLRINWGPQLIRYATITPVTDGYAAYNKPYVHVDHHSINIVPVDEATNSFWIVNGNDGGVAYSTNSGVSWTEALRGGYNTTQFYGIDKKHGADEYMGGTQDNGTWKSPAGQSANLNSAYARTIGGDGFDVAWHYTDLNKIIGGYQNNGFVRTTNGGSSWVSATDGLSDKGDGKGQFISKIAESDSDPDIIFTTGSEGVWRSEDFGGNWNKTTVSGWYFNDLSTPVAISIADPQIVWAGAAISSSYSYLFVSRDGGLSFTPTKMLNVTMGNITGIDTHPTDPNTAYITFSYSGTPKIFKTTDLGETWTDITGFTGSVSSNGFPDVATYCVVVMPYNTNIIWAGTEIGLFESLDGGQSWLNAANGLPAVCIWDMKIVDDQVILATHGRGIYTVALPQLAGYTPPAVTLSPFLLSATQSFAGVLNIGVNLRSAYDSTKVFIDGVSALRNLNTTAGVQTLTVPTSRTGTVNIQVIGYKLGRGYKSTFKSLSLISYKPVQNSYSNNFNTASADFSGTGFSITKPTGFASNAIHTVHPYVESTNYIYNLLVPINVSPSNPFVEYDDIALVEPGDPGTHFGDIEFWDYVVVEGSKDGITWIPIADGYDCRLDSRWSAMFDPPVNPDSSHYVHHKVSLLTNFREGDQIILRFRMFSDEAVVGWGWAIDNIYIQQSPPVGIEKDKAIPTQFALMQNYPNPFNPSTTIRFSLPQAENVKLQIYDSLGRLIETLVDSRLEAGYYTYKWNAKNYASGVYIYRITAGTHVDSKKLSLLK